MRDPVPGPRQAAVAAARRVARRCDSRGAASVTMWGHRWAGRLGESSAPPGASRSGGSRQPAGWPVVPCRVPSGAVTLEGWLVAAEWVHRHSTGLTRSDLARRAGVSSMSVTEFLAGWTFPRADTSFGSVMQPR